MRVIGVRVTLRLAFSLEPSRHPPGKFIGLPSGFARISGIAFRISSRRRGSAISAAQSLAASGSSGTTALA